MEQDTTKMSHDDNERLLGVRRISARNGVALEDEALKKLMEFVRMVREWNTRVNLISRRDVDNIWEAHVLHSLSILFECPLPGGCAVLDLGSGGGLPGIPLKIARPDLSLTMLDATRKKIEAVTDMVSRLGLDGSRGVWGRAEDASVRKDLGDGFDVVVARAVAPLQDLVRWSRPFLRRTGIGDTKMPRLIALKGGDLEKEVGLVTRNGGVGEVSVKALTFAGAETIPGIDKKIVSVYF